MGREGRGRRIAVLLLLCLLQLSLPLAPARAQEPLPDEEGGQIEALIDAMSPAERVGQLFLITFPGNNLTEGSIARQLVQELRVGGVVLRASNNNYVNDEQTASGLATLTSQLQALALEASAEGTGSGPFVPLFVGIEQASPTRGFTDGLPLAGFTRVPSEMALGATWSAENATLMGRVVGKELQTVGINLLFGPILDVAPQGSMLPAALDSRTFGGSPHWVGRLGRAFVQGVAAGGEGQVATVALHFPGMGSSDRSAEEEIATVQKPLAALATEDLLPFTAVVQGTEVLSHTVDGLMTTNLRYRAFQGNVRQTTRPISLDAQSLPALLGLPEIQPWREGGGIVVSDELGALALRRFYQQQSGSFPARTVARDAFNAGNDLLFLSDFALTDDWAARTANIRATLQFFVEQYESDPVFASEVDESLQRLLALKLRLYDGTLAAAAQPRPDPATLDPSPLRTPDNLNAVARIAQEAATLLYPTAAELAGVLPSPPLGDEQIVIVSDARTVRDCADCPPQPVIDPLEFENSLLRRYGPGGSGQVDPATVTSLTTTEIAAVLAAGAEASVEVQRLQATLEAADWLIFLVQEEGASVLSEFLRTFNGQVRGQKLLVFAFGPPHYLDATEVSKVTAYYGFYFASPTFVDAAVLLLFQGYSPTGASPVSVQPVNYVLEEQLQPDPAQAVGLCLDDPTAPPDACVPLPPTLDASNGGELALRTTVILDRNGNPVPDGTEVHFILRYPNENIEQPRQTVRTVGGIARATVVLDRQGQLAISVVADSQPSFTSTTVNITIQGSAPPVVETVVPSPTPTPTPTLTPLPSETPRPRNTRPPASPTPSPTPTEVPITRLGQHNDGFGWWTLMGAILGLSAVGSVGVATAELGRVLLVRRLLLVALYGLGGYLVFLLLYAFRLLPEDFNGWGAIFLAMVGGFMALLRER